MWWPWLPKQVQTETRGGVLPISHVDVPMPEVVRPCTCHPDDWPRHIPCQRKYAFKDCAIEAIRQNLAMIK